MTESGIRVRLWKPVPGFPGYQASHRGEIRSVDRVVAGRNLKGVVLKTRPSNQPSGRPPEQHYRLVNLRDADGSVVTKTVHSCVMLAHAGPCPPGQEVRHLNDDPTDNRWPENLAYGTKLDNAQDKFANGRPRAAPKPDRFCIRCGAKLTSNGRRCHPCVVEIGEEAAPLLAAGVKLDEVCKRLGYPSETGLHELARRYGGYGVQPSPSVPEPAAHQPLSHRVTAGLRRLTGRGDAQ